MVRLEYFNGKEWTTVEYWQNAEIAWATLGGDTFNYRLIDEYGKVIKEDTVFDKSQQTEIHKEKDEPSIGYSHNEGWDISDMH